MLVVADVYGRSPFYEDLAARLAVAGFHALLPDSFFRQGPLAEQTREAAIARRPQLDDLRAIADYSAAIDWLRGRPGVADEPGRGDAADSWERALAFLRRHLGTPATTAVT